MEGVGARLGRSSSRYGTTTVFNGPVRKWKKDWVAICPSSNSNNNNSNHHHQNSSSSSLVNGNSINSNNGSVSHLRLFRWTPINQTSNKENNGNPNHKNVINGDITPGKDSNKDGDDAVVEEPPRRKFKYIPIAVLEEHKKGNEENSDDEVKPVDADENITDQALKGDVGHDEKPDINDMPMEENQVNEENRTAPGWQDLNESLDLSLGLTSHEEGHDTDSRTDPTKDGDQERVISGAAKKGR